MLRRIPYGSFYCEHGCSRVQVHGARMGFECLSIKDRLLIPLCTEERRASVQQSVDQLHISDALRNGRVARFSFYNGNNFITEGLTMTESAEWDPVAEWLKKQQRQGRSRRAIAEDLGVNPSTVTRNIEKMETDESFGPKFRKAIEKRVVVEQVEGERLAREATVREAAEQRARGERERQAAEQRARRRRVERAAEERAREKRDLEERLERTRRQLAEVSSRLRRKDIIEGETLYGDAAYLLSVGANVIHYDAGVEEIAFAPNGFVFPCGWIAEKFRYRVTADQRMQPSAVPAGAQRPDTIGARAANIVSFVVWPDERWFYGRDYSLVDTWRKLKARPLLDEDNPPFLPTDEEVDWYEELLRVELELLERGYVVPGTDDPMLTKALPLLDKGMRSRRIDFEKRMADKKLKAVALRRMASFRTYLLGFWYLATPISSDTRGEVVNKALTTMLVLGLVMGTAVGLLRGVALGLLYVGQSIWMAAQAITGLLA